MNIKVGKSYRALLFGSSIRKVHVVGIIEEQIVFKFYSRKGARWKYQVYPYFGFNLTIEYARQIEAGSEK